MGAILVVTVELVGVPSLLVAWPLLLVRIGSKVAALLRAVLLIAVRVAGAVKLTVRVAVAPFASAVSAGKVTMPETGS